MIKLSVMDKVKGVAVAGIAVAGIAITGIFVTGFMGYCVYQYEKEMKALGKKKDGKNVPDSRLDEFEIFM